MVVFAEVTNAVVASWVVFVPAVAVGARGVPVNVGLTDITTLPVPVIGFETNPLFPSENTGKDAVNVESIGCELKVVTPVTPSVPPTVVFPVKVEVPLTFKAVNVPTVVIIGCEGVRIVPSILVAFKVVAIKVVAEIAFAVTVPVSTGEFALTTSPVPVVAISSKVPVPDDTLPNTLPLVTLWILA